MRTATLGPVMALAGLLGVFFSAIAQAETSSRACPSTTRYSVVDLPFIPRVITSSGVVAGMTELRRAVVWRRKSGVEELSVPEGFRYTEPVAITKAGDVVINASDAEGHKRRAFVYSNHSLVALAGNQTWAHGTGSV